MSKRISGMSFDTYLDGDLIHIEKITLDITDNSAAAQTRGVPDGHVDGDVAAEGEIEVSSKVLGVLTAKARAAGSWRGIREHQRCAVSGSGSHGKPDRIRKPECRNMKKVFIHC